MVFTVSICVVISVVGIVINRKCVNYLSVFGILWAVVAYLASQQLFDLIFFSEKVYLISTIGCIGFTIGYLVTRKFNIKRGTFQKTQLKTQVIANNDTVHFKALEVLLLISLCYYIYSAIDVTKLLLSGVNWTTIRYRYSIGITTNDNLRILKLLNTFVFGPVILYVAPTLLIGFIATGKRFIIVKKLIILEIVAFSLYFYCTQGKIYIVILLEYIFAIIYIFPNHYSKKIRISLTFIALLAFLLIFFTTQVRAEHFGKSNNFFENIYSYLVCGYPRMSYWISIVDTRNIYGYGIAFFSGLFNTTSDIIGIFGIAPPKIVVLNMSLLQETISTGLRIIEGGSENANTFVTSFFFFYLDFRMFGVFFGSLIFGSMSGFVEKNIYKNKIFNYALYLLLLHNVIGSIVMWRFYMTDYWLSFVYLIFLSRNRSKYSVRMDSLNC